MAETSEWTPVTLFVEGIEVGAAESMVMGVEDKDIDIDIDVDIDIEYKIDME